MKSVARLLPFVIDVTERGKSPLREGPALLQGLVRCGLCGKRMTVSYHSRRGELFPEELSNRSPRLPAACQNCAKTHSSEIASLAGVAVSTPRCPAKSNRIKQSHSIDIYSLNMLWCRTTKVTALGSPQYPLLCDLKEGTWSCAGSHQSCL